jgi:hypothetical protein
MLREYVRVGETERKLYGEVMTPVDLVEEMLDGLPKRSGKTQPSNGWIQPTGAGSFRP